jgi:hemolysin III
MLTMEPPALDAAKPMLRGYLHLASAIVAPFALAYLVFLGESPREIVGAAVFGGSLIALYWTSASYHLLVTRRFRKFMSRLDRSVIFLFIPGAYTPVVLNLMSDAWGVPIMSGLGVVAVVGLVITWVAPDAPRWIRVGLYLMLGWTGIVGIPELTSVLSGEALALLALAGVLFSGGGAIYAARRPDPFPRVFGYHEVFHAMQVAGTAVFYYVVAVYVVQ